MKRPLRRGLRIESLESRLALAVDLAVDVSDGDTEVHPGDTVVYRLDYVNHGDTGATGVKLGDLVLPRAIFIPNDGDDNPETVSSTPGWDCGMAAGPAFIHCQLDIGDLAPGGSGFAELAVTVPDDGGHATSSIRGAHLLWNFARISDDGANGRDANPRNNRDVERTPITRPRIVADLKIDVSDDDATATPGGSLVYTVDYANAGTGDATGVVVRQVLPAFTEFDEATSEGDWTCTPMFTANSLFRGGTVCTLEVGDLGAGDDGTATLGVTVAQNVPSRLTRLTTTVSISTRAFHIDPTPHNNFDVEHTPIAHPPVMAPDLKIATEVAGGPATPGGTLTYTFNFANTGTAEATGVVLTEFVPAFTRADAAANPDWNCHFSLAPMHASAICTLEVGTLAPDATGTAQLVVTVADRLPSTLRAIRNVVRIRDDGTHGRDSTPENNVSYTETPIERTPPPAPMLSATRR
jgi:uncharacterized repeat protein (TIGR01451 family)